MDMATQINKVISHIETHLLEKNDYETLAKIACCSVYNLQRLFSSAANMSIVDYIRRRRMSLAGAELIKTNTSIIDIALKYGYESSEAFSRAFQMVYNVLPSDMRKTKAGYVPFSRINISVEVSNVDSMKFSDVVQETMEDTIGGISLKTVRMSELTFIGKLKKGGMVHIKEFWDECHKNGYTDKLYSMQKNFRDFGIFINGEDYMIAIEKPADEYDFSEYDKITVPAGMWAVAYGRFDRNYINTPKYWEMIIQYLADTQYVVDQNVPVIEKFPDGAEPLDQTYMLMKPIKIKTKSEGEKNYAGTSNQGLQAEI